jgi:iron complex outermembrane recepter protein
VLSRSPKLLYAWLLAGLMNTGSAWAQAADTVPPATVPPATVPPAIVPPAVVHQHEAVYPESERAANRLVQVVLLVTVDDAGHVTKIDVAESGGQAFDEAAIVAMREWLFTPATKGGARMASRIRVPVNFSPKAAEAPTPVEVPAKATAPTSAPTPAHGTPAPAPPPSPLAPVAPETVYAHGRSHIPSRGAGDHEIVLGKLASVPRMDAASLLRLAPGVMMTNAGGLGHPYQIFLRGFDAREGQDIEFTLDGTPINEVGNVHGNGLADTHFIIPELVHRLRIIEGPFAPQQGNFAVAGSALYDVGIEKPGLTLSGMMGSFGTKRVLALWRPENSSDHTFGGGELFSSNGFGENRAADRASAMAGYEGNLGNTGRYRFLATSYAARRRCRKWPQGLLRHERHRARWRFDAALAFWQFGREGWHLETCSVHLYDPAGLSFAPELYRLSERSAAILSVAAHAAGRSHRPNLANPHSR